MPRRDLPPFRDLRAFMTFLEHRGQLRRIAEPVSAVHEMTEIHRRVLREEGTEFPYSSKLNDEKRKGVYVCAGCSLPVFTSAMKFDSGTGWPSFFTTIPGAFGTSTDHKIMYPRIEYHCSKCGGHHGHVFDDGPKPTGQRWCNNGVSLRFIPFIPA